jgi:hypothetical protein
MSKPSPMAVFRHRDFTILWAGSALGVFGGQFTTVATAWQIYELTNSALQLGLLGLARAIPQMGFLLFGGMLADAMDRRRLISPTRWTADASCRSPRWASSSPLGCSLAAPWRT